MIQVQRTLLTILLIGCVLLALAVPIAFWINWTTHPQPGQRQHGTAGALMFMAYSLIGMRWSSTKLNNLKGND